jgi:hypothetical protein
LGIDEQEFLFNAESPLKAAGGRNARLILKRFHGFSNEEGNPGRWHMVRTAVKLSALLLEPPHQPAPESTGC